MNYVKHMGRKEEVGKRGTKHNELRCSALEGSEEVFLAALNLLAKVNKMQGMAGYGKLAETHFLNSFLNSHFLR